MSYPKTGQEVYVSLNLSNTMLTGIGKGTITREEVSVDYLKKLFEKYGVIVSAKPEQARLLQIVNDTFLAPVVFALPWHCTPRAPPPCSSLRIRISPSPPSPL